MPIRKNNKKSGVRADLKRLEHRIQGVSIRAAADPPTFVASPWYNITVSFQVAAGSPIEHTPLSIRTQMITQLGLTPTPVFQIRIREVRVWGALGGDIRCEFNDFFNGVLLSEVSDVGNLTQRPHCGYVFPSAIATRPLDNTLTSNVLTVTSGANPVTNSAGIVIRYLLQFKFDGQSVPPT